VSVKNGTVITPIFAGKVVRPAADAAADFDGGSGEQLPTQLWRGSNGRRWHPGFAKFDNTSLGGIPDLIQFLLRNSVRSRERRIVIVPSDVQS